jgi:hypothetical protein
MATRVNPVSPTTSRHLHYAASARRVESGVMLIFPPAATRTLAKASILHAEGVRSARCAYTGDRQ